MRIYGVSEGKTTRSSRQGTGQDAEDAAVGHVCGKAWARRREGGLRPGARHSKLRETPEAEADRVTWLTRGRSDREYSGHVYLR